ncbi:CLUMA_CG017551, isoform A [Clunio marinus]|uniref:CLUMA_CG017551, isoform A n=1 Tax=Clunio marinus TaxID=568069 RepID=A0A1J1IW81_9DIPT|nr:CLUMA_CG017551, isoform A [Clunio marinus]
MPNCVLRFIQREIIPLKCFLNQKEKRFDDDQNRSKLKATQQSQFQINYEIQDSKIQRCWYHLCKPWCKPTLISKRGLAFI